MYGFEPECEECDWALKCKKMDESIESAATRKGTHVRLTGKYKEKNTSQGPAGSQFHTPPRPCRVHKFINHSQVIMN
jgi:hypothetical protein